MNILVWFDSYQRIYKAMFVNTRQHRCGLIGAGLNQRMAVEDLRYKNAVDK